MNPIVLLVKHRNRITMILAVLCIIYCASAINILLLATGFVKYIPELYMDPAILLWFSIISFGFAIVLCVYFFFNAMGRRRRKDDLQQEDADVDLR